MIPTMPVMIGFDPRGKPWWQHRQTRDLVLLWRPGHIINQYFWDEVCKCGLEIEDKKPQTACELASCLRGSNFMFNDVKIFSESAIPYFTGEKTATWHIKPPAPSGLERR